MVKQYKCRVCGADNQVVDSDRPRTTGPNSQNHRINGFIQQICMEQGDDFDVVKMRCKRRALGMGYPFCTDAKTGEAVPWSESRLNTAQASILIEAIQLEAAEIPMILREDV
jgi:hypothetical protein